MPGHLAGLVVNRKTKIGAAVLTNTGAGAAPEKLALDLAVAAIEALPAAPEPWQPGEAAPPEIEPLLGRWWTEGARDRVLVAQRPARGEARRRACRAATPRTSSPTARTASACVEGRERGELLRVVRDADGAIEKLYFATYPLAPRAVDVLCERSPAA